MPEQKKRKPRAPAPDMAALAAGLTAKTAGDCSPHTLLEWVKKADRDSGRAPGVPSDVAPKLKTLERENRDLCQANEILRKASAYFA